MINLELTVYQIYYLVTLLLVSAKIILCYLQHLRRKRRLLSSVDSMLLSNFISHSISKSHYQKYLMLGNSLLWIFIITRINKTVNSDTVLLVKILFDIYIVINIIHLFAYHFHLCFAPVAFCSNLPNSAKSTASINTTAGYHFLF